MAQPKNQFIDLNNTRFEDQRAQMEKILAAGHCPFCPENLELYHTDPILKQGKFWFLTPNHWPYENTKVHLLAIATSHVEKLSDLPTGAGDELMELFSWAINEYKIPGGAFAMRFGDTRYSAGTVQHLHAQFIIPDVDKSDFQPVRFKIGSNPPS